MPKALKDAPNYKNPNYGQSLTKLGRIVSDSKSETWHYSRDTGVNARVDFDKKLMRFRVESWVEPKK